MGSREEWQNATDITGDLDLDRRLLEAVTGVGMTRDDLEGIAERAFTLERAMLARAGRQRSMEEGLAGHFELPCRADGTRIDRAGFSRLMDEYYSARGWDLDLGWPKAQKFAALGLEFVAPEIAELRLRFAGAEPTSA
jgi:aldehyde:ferredoxin oxidoreductase